MSKKRHRKAPRNFPIYEVEWIDAHGGGISWEKGYKSISNYPDSVTTVGYLVDDCKRGLTLVLSMTHRGHVDAYIFIPRSCIVKEREIKFKK